jgi:GxxExxY protein
MNCGELILHALSGVAAFRIGPALRQMLEHEGTKDNKVTKAFALALSHEVIGAAIEVHRVLGPGLLESIYEAALCRELSLRNIRYVRQKRLPVIYKEQLLDCELRLDLLVEDAIIVEVKALEKLMPIHRIQLLSYLRLHGVWLGLVINFDVEVLRDGLRRVLNG